MAAIDVLDAVVVASGGEVITFADRKAAITELDAAVDASARTFPRLSEAVAQVQRLKAWTIDEGFGAALAAGTVEVGADGDHFAAWAGYRYQWAMQYAYRIGAAGRVIGAIGSTSPMGEVPQNERQVRPLTRLLGKHEDSIPAVWQQAIDEAEADHKPQSVARYVDRIIRSEWPEMFERRAKTQDELHAEADRHIRRLRDSYRFLEQHLPSDDFDERVTRWISNH